MSDLVTQHRTEGNGYFREKKYFDACRCYEAAIAACPESDNKQLSVIYTNLSASQLQIEKLNEAITSSSKAIELDNTNVKAFYRNGQALAGCLDFKGAYDAYLAAAKLQPNEKFWRNCMDGAKKQLYKHRLREAMSSDDLNADSKVELIEPTTEPIEIPEFTIEYARNLMVEMQNDKRPHPAVVRAMIGKMKELNKQMQNIVNVSHPGTMRVVGDTHGQYQDFINIFKQYGEPSPENPYLFNGDYVDRGSMGTEIVLALLAWKLAIPDGIYMNRGNQYVFEKTKKAIFLMFPLNSIFHSINFFFRSFFVQIMITSNSRILK
ncbi:hypothetical protein TRFO_35154 [Tritrichomonas foetus]|uniref:Serine/threonine specific protein phosphatases domain-containing protein n=1 Tax=Tritrichomonas foetus TaxID=1144522 RepID=A0A1J4JLK0_9EUKA|nr:hypothetical protein TRFO_35154 [Tritrichomonas foetus]|eukprot:OHS98443.1 hypothetical protein TRFO_35154 [Tritrichomonas foetus]